MLGAPTLQVGMLELKQHYLAASYCRFLLFVDINLSFPGCAALLQYRLPAWVVRHAHQLFLFALMPLACMLTLVH